MTSLLHRDRLANEPWHSYTIQDVFSEMASSEKGVSPKEIQHRLSFYGRNVLPEARKTTLWEIILHQLLNPLIFILMAAAAASFAIG